MPAADGQFVVPLVRVDESRSLFILLESGVVEREPRMSSGRSMALQGA